MDSINGTNGINENTVSEAKEKTVKKVKVEYKASEHKTEDGQSIFYRHTGGRGRPVACVQKKQGAVMKYIPIRPTKVQHETGAMVKIDAKTHDGKPLFKKVSNTRGRPALFTKEGEEFVAYKRPVVKKEKVVAEVVPVDAPADVEADKGQVV